MQKSTIQKIQNSIIISLFALLLLASFILINTTSGALFSGSRADLTSDRLNTLSPRSEEIIAGVNKPIYVKLYLSSQISRQNPVLAQYAQNVIRLLGRYQDKSGHLIKLEILDPEPYSNVESEAKAAGLVPLADIKTEKLYFGAVFSDDKGRSYSIPQFSPQRLNYLENDLSRAVSNILMPKRKIIGIASDLPLVNSGFMNAEKKQNWTFVNLLAKDYAIAPISATTAEIPNVDVLIVVATGKLPSLFIYALDQYILRGGRLLLIVDPASEVKKRLHPGIPDEKLNLNALLDNLGIHYISEQVLGDREQAVEAFFAATENTDARNHIYYPWIKIKAPHLNPQSPLTAGLNSIFLKSPGAFALKDEDGHTAESLLVTSENTMLTAADLVKFAPKADVLRYMDVKKQAYSAAALSQGSYHTIFAKNPLENSAYAKQILPFLTTSVAPAQIIAVSDSDILDVRNWTESENAGDYAENDYNLTPVNNNFDFIQRAVDFLSGNPGAMNVAAKKYGGSRQTLADIFYQSGLKTREKAYKEINGRLEENQRKLDTINIMLESNSAFGTAQTLGEIDALKNKIRQEKNELRRIEYQIKSEVTHREHMVALINTVIVPLLLLLLIAAVHLWLSHRNNTRARRLINE
ncbi:MAG: GldG family protein [Alphaproteobacteria bacterium]|nr:GldG family protein [Alphaproteobacteria bacterium]